MEHQIEFRTVVERLAILEQKAQQFDDIKDELKEVAGKLDKLLEFRAKGLGALWFASLLISSGLVGVVTFVISLFGHKH